MTRPAHDRVLSVAVAAALLASCSRPPADVVARSDLGDLTSRDLEAYVLSLPETRRGPGPAEEPRSWRRSLVEEMLVERALAEEGRRAGALDRPAAKAWIQAQEDAWLVEEVKARRIAERAKVTDAEVRAFYDAHPEEVSHQGQIRVRHIFRRVPRDAPAASREAARREMNDLLRELRSGMSFEETARARSDSDTASLGGLIGRLNHGDLSPSVEAVVWRLKDGEISEVLATPVGFHVFKLENHIPPFKMDFEEARERLRKRLMQEAIDRTLRDQVGELATSLGASYRPEALMSPDGAALVFALGDFRMNRADWDRAFAGKPFAAQREKPLRDQLDEAVGDRLRLAEARRQRLEDEPATALRLGELRQQTLVRLARDERLRTTLPDAEVRAFYEANRSRFTEPRLHRLSLVTLAFPNGKADYGVFERLRALAAEVRAGRRALPDVAREFSTDLSAPRGGDTGLIRLEAIGDWAGPRALSQVEKLKLGELSEPILVERYARLLLRYRRQGYMLVRIEDVREARPQTFGEVQHQAREALLSQRHAEVLRRFNREVLASIHAQVYDRNL